jgi:hypothetical protein
MNGYLDTLLENFLVVQLYLLVEYKKHLYERWRSLWLRTGMQKEVQK